MMRRSCVFTYVLLSLAFITVNIVTFSNRLPWIDEVMFLDTSYNAAVHGSWATTAWYRVAGQYPFSTYPPLYQMLAAVWMRLFGAGLVAVRSLNLLVTFVLGGVCLQMAAPRSSRAGVGVGLLFALLLWGTSEMAWMYRNGRPDMLCALVFVLAVQAVVRHLQSKSPATLLAVVATSALLVGSGIQAAVCLCAFWLFLFLTLKGRRREVARLLVLLLTGFLLGLLLVALFMLAHGRLLAFASSIIQYSSTLSGIALTVLPAAGEWFGFDSAPYTQKLLELTTPSSLSERVAPIVEYRSFILLSVAALAAYADCFRHHRQQLLTDKGFLSLLFALFVPAFMLLAGRFVAYYRWMAFLPLLVSITSIAARHRRWCTVFGVLAVLLTVSGIRSMLPDEASGDYANLRSLVQRQHFRSSDAVVCPFSVFYEIKPVCDTCYFAGIFPQEFIGHVDYIIEAPDGDAFDQPITDYVNRLKADTTVVLTAIDHCQHPTLTIYQVQSRHE